MAETKKGKKKLSFSVNHEQLYADPWRGKDRMCRYKGKCTTCGKRTYAFDDGENDPRGILGDHAADPLYASDYKSAGPDIAMCFICMNSEPSYRRGLDIARRFWVPHE